MEWTTTEFDEMKTAWAIAFGVVCGLLGAGLILLVSSPARGRGQPILLEPQPTQSLWQVHVDGAVLFPGVYQVQPDSRVQDAVQAAGGFAPQADLQSLNLAAFLQDGGRVYVPSLSTPMPSASAAEKSPSLDASAFLQTDRVNINTASQSELESLPEIGPVTAQKIIAYRQEHGAFQSIEQILDVPGIGPLTFEAIKDRITVGAQTAP